MNYRVAAIRRRLADWPYTGWAVEDCHTLLEIMGALQEELDKFKNAPVPVHICGACDGKGYFPKGRPDHCRICFNKGWIRKC